LQKTTTKYKLNTIDKYISCLHRYCCQRGWWRSGRCWTRCMYTYIVKVYLVLSIL